MLLSSLPLLLFDESIDVFFERNIVTARALTPPVDIALLTINAVLAKHSGHMFLLLF